MPHNTGMHRKALGLYIHFPWCVAKCPYCDFNSHAVKETLPKEEYIDALWKDFESLKPFWAHRPIDTIFLGGGTPSLFSASDLAPFFEKLHKTAHLDSHIEITLEANPGTLDNDHLTGYPDLGIQRLSIGAQSFSNTHLKTLGRIHHAEHILKAYHTASTLFPEINLDIMYGLPNQSLEEAMEDLNTAIGLSPSHLSWYELTIEPNTWFYHHPPKQPCSDDLAFFAEQGQQLLAHHGYQRYEISAYTQKYPCRHNLHYWHYDDYLGIGAGAHSKVSDEEQQVWRFSRHKHPKHYLTDPVFKVEHTPVEKTQQLFEFALNRFRLSAPIPEPDFFAYLTPEALESVLQAPIHNGWLLKKEGWIHLPPLGWRLYNEVVECCLPDLTRDDKSLVVQPDLWLQTWFQ